jgi:hypothetical protein
MSFDLIKLDAKTLSMTGKPMKIFHPRSAQPIVDDAGQEVTITLKGKYSDEYKAAMRVVSDRARDRAARGVQITPEENKREEVDILTAVTVGWTFDQLGGVPFPFTPENARVLWSDERFAWVFEQATRFAANDGNFLAI